MEDASEMFGVNNRVQLSEVESLMQQRIIHDWQMNGVTIEKPESGSY